jgi:hypothetical protein
MKRYILIEVNDRVTDILEFDTTQEAGKHLKFGSRMVKADDMADLCAKDIKAEVWWLRRQLEALQQTQSEEPPKRDPRKYWSNGKIRRDKIKEEEE